MVCDSTGESFQPKIYIGLPEFIKEKHVHMYVFSIFTQKIASLGKDQNQDMKGLFYIFDVL